MTHRYLVHGLVLDSDLPLPELHPAEADAPAQIQLRRGGLTAPPAEARFHGPYFQALGDTAWFSPPGAGRYQMHAGRQIHYEPPPASDAPDPLATTRLYLLGGALGALLFQRGRLVLHGNAIRVGDRAILCLGRSGAGKSTLAGLFQNRGYPVLADDACALDEADRVHPGLPRIRLWPDSVQRLGLAPEGLRQVRPEEDKIHLPLEPIPQRTALPAGPIYILRGDRQDRLGLEPCAGPQALMLLHRHTYRPGFLQAMGLQAWHLTRLARLANHTRVVRLMRPRSRFETDALVDLILADACPP